MKHNPLVSVCIITYNQEAFIEKCLEGAISQKADFEYEIIIGEDHSTDNTAFICRQYANKYAEIIQLNQRTENVGMIENWIQTINACSGKYIAICEGDDYWTDPYKLQKQVNFLEVNPEYAICFHKVMLLQENRLVDDWITAPPKEDTDINDLIKFRNFIHTPSTLFRNKNFQFPPQFSISPVADYFLYILLTQDGSKIKCLPEVMAVYRYGVGIYGKTGDNEQLWNWYNTQFLIYSCIAKNHKKPFATAIAKTKLQLESYAAQHITSAKYLSQEIKLKVLLKAAKMKIRKELKKKFK